MRKQVKIHQELTHHHSWGTLALVEHRTSCAAEQRADIDSAAFLIYDEAKLRLR